MLVNRILPVYGHSVMLAQRAAIWSSVQDE